MYPYVRLNAYTHDLENRNSKIKEDVYPFRRSVTSTRSVDFRVEANVARNGSVSDPKSTRMRSSLCDVTYYVI